MASFRCCGNSDLGEMYPIWNFHLSLAHHLCLIFCWIVNGGALVTQSWTVSLLDRTFQYIVTPSNFRYKSQRIKTKLKEIDIYQSFGCGVFYWDWCCFYSGSIFLKSRRCLSKLSTLLVKRELLDFQKIDRSKNSIDAIMITLIAIKYTAPETLVCP